MPSYVGVEHFRLISAADRHRNEFAIRAIEPSQRRILRKLVEILRISGTQSQGNSFASRGIGLVLEYFIKSGVFEKLHSYSLRGLPRPQDDRYAGQLPLSDPVYAAWGRKR